MNANRLSLLICACVAIAARPAAATEGLESEREPLAAAWGSGPELLERWPGAERVLPSTVAWEGSAQPTAVVRVPLVFDGMKVSADAVYTAGGLVRVECRLLVGWETPSPLLEPAMTAVTRTFGEASVDGPRTLYAEGAVVLTRSGQELRVVERPVGETSKVLDGTLEGHWTRPEGWVEPEQRRSVAPPRAPPPGIPEGMLVTDHLARVAPLVAAGSLLGPLVLLGASGRADAPWELVEIGPVATITTAVALLPGLVVIEINAGYVRVHQGDSRRLWRWRERMEKTARAQLILGSIGAVIGGGVAIGAALDDSYAADFAGPLGLVGLGVAVGQLSIGFSALLLSGLPVERSSAVRWGPAPGGIVVLGEFGPLPGSALARARR